MKKHLKTITKDTLIYLSGTVISKIGAFFLLPLYTHYLSPDDYGIMSYVGTVCMFFEIFVLMGMHGTILRFYFDFKDNEKDLRDFLGTVNISVVLIAVSVYAVIEVVAGHYPFIFSTNISYVPYFRFGLVIVLFSIIPTFNLIYFRAQNNPVKFVGYSLATFFLQTGLVIYFVAVKQKGLLGNYEGILISIIIMHVLHCFIIFRHINFTINKDKLISSLKFGLPLIPGSIAGYLTASSGVFFLERFVSLQVLGIYSLGASLSKALMMVISGFKTAWYPFFFQTIEEDKGDEIIARLTTLYVSGLLAGALVLNALLYEVIVLFMDKRYHDAYQVVPFMIMACIFEGLYYIPNSAILYKKKSHYQAGIVCIIAVFSVGFNYIMSRTFGMHGVAFTLLLSSFFLFTANLILGNKSLALPYEYRRLAIIFLIFTVSYIAISFVSYWESPYRFGLKMVLLLNFPLCLYVGKFFTPSELQWLNKILHISSAESGNR